MTNPNSAHLDPDDLSRRTSGKSVARITSPQGDRLAIHFTDGSILLVERHRQSLAATVRSAALQAEDPAPGAQPTRRQREYLEFIAKYFVRFGISPAESDIQRHFLLSAPSVNRMVQTLERRGFITRRRGVPRSIRLVEHFDEASRMDNHTITRADGPGPNSR